MLEFRTIGERGRALSRHRVSRQKKEQRRAFLNPPLHDCCTTQHTKQPPHSCSVDTRIQSGEVAVENNLEKT